MCGSRTLELEWRCLLTSYGSARPSARNSRTSSRLVILCRALLSVVESARSCARQETRDANRNDGAGRVARDARCQDEYDLLQTAPPMPCSKAPQDRADQSNSGKVM